MLVLVLSLSAGLGDAFAFLALGGIFTANMTGNVVLSTLFTRGDYAATLLGAAGAVVAFAAAAFLAFRRMERAPDATDQPPAALPLRRATLVPAIVIETLAALAWSIADDRTATRVGVIMACAAVSGLQSAAMKRATAAGGATTTYVTGTIVGVMDDLARGRSGVGRRIASIGALVLGGLLGCAITALDTRLTPWACVIALGAALGLAGRLRSPRP